METTVTAPREGGVKVVVDVADADVDVVVTTVGAAGFDVQRYYRDDGAHGVAGGHTRLGAERPRRFVPDEQDAVLAEFQAVCARDGLAVDVVGVDVWEASGGGSAGDREPRRPRPVQAAGGAMVGEASV